MANKRHPAAQDSGGKFSEENRINQLTRRIIGYGLMLLVTSAVLFLVFATFFGGLDILGEYGLPVVLILLGIYVLARGFIRSGKRGSNEA